MKLLTTLMTTILMTAALTAKADEVPKEQASLYIKAVIAQIKAQDPKCPLFKGDKVGRSQKWVDAHRVYVESEGTQIIIQREDADRVIIYNIQTMSDRKTIIYVMAAVLKKTFVNLGTLAEPKESVEYFADPKSGIYCDFTVTK